MGQHSANAIRRVQFAPPAPGVVDIEVTSVAWIRERGGRDEFIAPQRLEFDLLMRVERGATVHTVDFQEYPIGAGDVIWVRAGQVHQWGRIDRIEGTVALFDPHVLDDHTLKLAQAPWIVAQSHWPVTALVEPSLARALDALFVIEHREDHGGSDLARAARAHALAAALLHLVRVQAQSRRIVTGSAHDAVARFRDELEENFAGWHHVTEYARRLGYSTRTLNAHVRASTGRSAKAVIDERVTLEAKRLLVHTDAPIGEIGETLGFDDASNFTNYFRRTAGTAPTAFRAERRNRSRP